MKSPRYYCECGKTLPKIAGGNWGQWKCIACGLSFCQDCGDQLDYNNECRSMANHEQPQDQGDDMAAKSMDQMRAEKASLLAERNKDQYRLIDEVRKEINEMALKIKLYKQEYSNIELADTFERWEQDLEKANLCGNEEDYL